MSLVVLGFGKAETFFKIILPQVVKRIIPPMSNELMTLVKDTALAQVIGVAEIFKLAGATMSSQFSTVPLTIHPLDIKLFLTFEPELYFAGGMSSTFE